MLRDRCPIDHRRRTDRMLRRSRATGRDLLWRECYRCTRDPDRAGTPPGASRGGNSRHGEHHKGAVLLTLVKLGRSGCMPVHRRSLCPSLRRFPWDSRRQGRHARTRVRSSGTRGGRHTCTDRPLQVMSVVAGLYSCAGQGMDADRWACHPPDLATATSRHPTFDSRTQDPVWSLFGSGMRHSRDVPKARRRLTWHVRERASSDADRLVPSRG